MVEVLGIIIDRHPKGMIIGTDTYFFIITYAKTQKETKG